MSFAKMNNFLFTEEGTSCPAGNAPKSCSYIKKNDFNKIKLAALNFKKLQHIWTKVYVKKAI